MEGDGGRVGGITHLIGSGNSNFSVVWRCFTCDDDEMRKKLPGFDPYETFYHKRACSNMSIRPFPAKKIFSFSNISETYAWILMKQQALVSA